MKRLLVVIAVAETATGLGLIALPSPLASLLLGAALETADAMIVARVAGFALVALGATCWLARDDTQSRAARGLVAAMTFYNAGVCALLVYAAVGVGMSGIGLWPVAIAHAGLAVWCLQSLIAGRSSS